MDAERIENLLDHLDGSGSDSEWAVVMELRGLGDRIESARGDLKAAPLARDARCAPYPPRIKLKGLAFASQRALSS